MINFKTEFEYSKFDEPSDYKKWTTDEIVNEVIDVCRQLRDLNDKEG